jgi:hypothetical protein
LPSAPASAARRNDARKQRVDADAVGPSSIASERVSPITPHLAEAYGVRNAKPSRPASDETLTMLALLDARSAGTARRRQLN